MKKLMKLSLALLACLVPAKSEAGRIEIAASEIATIQPEDSSLSPRILVKWSIPGELAEKEVEAAFINMTLAASGEEPLVVGLMPLTSEWGGNEVAWTSGWEKEGGDFDESGTETAIVTEGNGGTVTMDVRHLVRETLAGNRSDFGFIVVPDSTATGKLSTFDANASTKLAGAKLTVVYRERRAAVAKGE